MEVFDTAFVDQLTSFMETLRTDYLAQQVVCLFPLLNGYFLYRKRVGEFLEELVMKESEAYCKHHKKEVLLCMEWLPRILANGLQKNRIREIKDKKLNCPENRVIYKETGEKEYLVSELLAMSDSDFDVLVQNNIIRIDTFTAMQEHYYETMRSRELNKQAPKISKAITESKDAMKLLYTVKVDRKVEKLQQDMGYGKRD